MKTSSVTWAFKTDFILEITEGMKCLQHVLSSCHPFYDVVSMSLSCYHKNVLVNGQKDFLVMLSQGCPCHVVIGLYSLY